MLAMLLIADACHSFLELLWSQGQGRATGAAKVHLVLICAEIGWQIFNLIIHCFRIGVRLDRKVCHFFGRERTSAVFGLLLPLQLLLVGIILRRRRFPFASAAEASAGGLFLRFAELQLRLPNLIFKPLELLRVLDRNHDQVRVLTRRSMVDISECFSLSSRFIDRAVSEKVGLELLFKLLKALQVCALVLAGVLYEVVVVVRVLDRDEVVLV